MNEELVMSVKVIYLNSKSVKSSMIFSSRSIAEIYAKNLNSATIEDYSIEVAPPTITKCSSATEDLLTRANARWECKKIEKINLRKTNSTANPTFNNNSVAMPSSKNIVEK